MEEQVLRSAREPPGARSPGERRVYSEFAGILQGQLRLQASRVCMLLVSLGEGGMRSCLQPIGAQRCQDRVGARPIAPAGGFQCVVADSSTMEAHMLDMSLPLYARERIV